MEKTCDPAMRGKSYTLEVAISNQRSPDRGLIVVSCMDRLFLLLLKRA